MEDIINYASPFAADTHQGAAFLVIDPAWHATARDGGDLLSALEAKINTSKAHVVCPSTLGRYEISPGALSTSRRINSTCRLAAVSTERATSLLHLRPCDNSSERRPPRHRLLCITYTVEKSHHKAAVMYKTWGTQCDQHLIFTNGHSIEGVPQEAVVHSLPTFGAESYQNLWQKMRSIHDKMVDFRFPLATTGPIGNTTELRAVNVSNIRVRPFDYVFFGGDDVFLFVPNLRRYLMEHSYPQQMEREGGPMLVGYRHDPHYAPWAFSFISGAGYVMNEIAFHQLVDAAELTCEIGSVTHAEDVNSAVCLGQLGVESVDARDERGEDRFLVMSLGHMAAQGSDPGFCSWFRDYRDRPQPKGTEIMSQYVTLSHYVDPASAHRYFASHMAPYCAQ